MGLGGQVQHRIGPIAGEDLGNARRVTDIVSDKVIAGADGGLGHRLGTSGIGELVEVDDHRVGLTDVLPDDRRTDETRPSCHYDPQTGISAKLSPCRAPVDRVQG